MLLTDFDFPFDPALIADRPTEPRDQARLLVVPRAGAAFAHRRVAELPSLLNPADVLVVNDTKVEAVRLSGRKRPGGGRTELVLVKDLGDGLWEVLLKGKVRPGQQIDFNGDAHATVLKRDAAGTVIALTSRRPLREVISEIGQMPLPPYIKRLPTKEDRGWYQTVFARVEGSVAAPTAGLHFTEGLVAALRNRRIRLASITLHVGPATFKPVRAARIEDHPMSSEWMSVPEETVVAIRQARSTGGRVIAVGTTVVRALETAADDQGFVQPGGGETKLFIFPGYRFRAVDALLTNFHLPRTTLLMLVAAFAGSERVREAYREAVRERYRFYSYGDAMLIL